MSSRLSLVVVMTLATSCNTPRPADAPPGPPSSVSSGDSTATGAPSEPSTTGERPAPADAPPTIEELIAGWCASPMNRVQVLEDHAGKVGGYATSVNVRDSAISYYDAGGVFLGSFSLFGNPQTTEKSPGSIERLQQAYPVFRPLPCDP